MSMNVHETFGLKTPVFIVRGKHKPKPAFINGDLKTRRENGITKALVYHFNRDGDLIVDLMSLRSIVLVVFELEA